MGAKTGLGLAAIAAGVAVLAVSIALREPVGSEPPPAPTGGDEELAVVTADATAAQESVQEPGTSERRPAQLGAGAGGATSASTLLLYGSLVTSSGEEVPEAFVTLWNDEGERREATVAPGSWSIVGLSPGAWTVSARALSHYPLREELTLRSDVAETRHDLVLEPARVLRIRFVDAEGRVVIDAGTRVHPLMPGLGVVATLSPPGTSVPGVDGRMPDRSEAGQYLSPRTYWRVDGLPRDCAGLLVLTQPPPVYVSAVLRDVVLETRLDTGGGEELVFVLDEEALRSKLSALSLRLVDARTGAPLEGTVDLGFRDGGGSRPPRCGPDGVAQLEGLIPGLRELRVEATGHVSRTHTIRLEPGQTLDLDDVALPTKHPLEGQLVDEAGQGIAQRFSVISSDLVESPLDLENASGALVHGDGAFQVWNLGSGEPWLLLRHQDYAVNPLWLETDAEGRTTAVARRGTPVLLRHGKSASSELRYSIADAAGRPFWTRRVYDEVPIRLRLVPGSYQLLEGHDEVFTVLRTFEVGTEPVVLKP